MVTSARAIPVSSSVSMLTPPSIFIHTHLSSDTISAASRAVSVLRPASARTPSSTRRTISASLADASSPALPVAHLHIFGPNVCSTSRHVVSAVSAASVLAKMDRTSASERRASAAFAQKAGGAVPLA